MPPRYRLIFLGSGAFACPSLDRLLETGADDLAAVICQPDKPCGRDRRTAACAVKRHLADRDIPVLTPANINAPESLQALRDLAPDLLVVVSYGQFLKPALLAIPPAGCVNVHGSLLPKYRGAAPIQWAIARGETVTGVTTMFVNEHMDAGDILGRQECPILPEDTAATLHDRLATLGADLLLRTLDDLRHGRAKPEPQNPALATFAPKLTKTDGRLDWRLTACDLLNRIRAFHPWPGCYFEWPRGSGKWVAVLRAAAEPAAPAAEPGVILGLDPDGFRIQTGDGALRLIEVKPESRPAMPAADFARGRALQPGDRVG
jgi:methionyl-tRNA formyltransferase